MNKVIEILCDAYGLYDALTPREIKFNVSAENNILLENGMYFCNLNNNVNAEISVNTMMDVTTKKFTIEGWLITPEAMPSTSQYFLDYRDDANKYSGFYIGYGNNGFRFNSGDGTDRQYIGIPGSTANTPLHFALVVNIDIVLLYINGVLVDTVEYTLSTIAPANKLNLGRLGTGLTDTATASYVSDAKINSVIMWDGIKYNSDFIPEVINTTTNRNVNSITYGFEGLTTTALLSYKNNIISGIVSGGKPNTLYKVCLYSRYDNKLYAHTWSDKNDGSYVFKNLQINTEYYIVTIDHTRTYNAVIQDGIKPTKISR